MIKKIILSTISVFLVVLSVALFIDTTPASADASSFCIGKYPKTGSPEQKACRSGYEYGNESNPICGAQFSLPVEHPKGSGNFVQPDDLQKACVAGWEQWKKDDAACGSDASCKSTLRPDGNEPLTGSVGNSEDLSKPGPIPKSADIKTLKGDQRQEHVECGMEGLFGELICDFSDLGANIADSAFWLLTIFLKVPPLITTSGSGQQGQGSTTIYDAWVNVRNVANVAFVFAFIVVIYSQLTGMGLSNYNIKKMIPRLIVAALMINISFYVCALLVDLSNVLGGTLASTLPQLVPPVQTVSGDAMDTWKQIVGSMLLLTSPIIAAGAAVLFLDLSALIPILASVVIVLAVTLIMLIMRQALIIVFIIISPLAMAALILPGTRQWFDKWRKIFIPIVMLYPSIAFVYGASNIASQIISRVGYANDSMLLAIAGLGIQVVPLALTPMLMKLGGGLMSRYAGIAQSSTYAGKFKKKADDYAKYRGSVRINKALNRQSGGKIRTAKNALTNPRDKMLQRKLAKQAARKNVDLIHSSAMEDYAIDQMSNDDTSVLEKAKEKASFGRYSSKTEAEKFNKQVAGTNEKDALSRAKARTIKKKVDMHADKVKAQALALSRNGVSGSALNEIALQGTANGQQVSEIQREAAILRIAQMGDAAGVIQMMKISGQGGVAVGANGQQISYPPMTVSQRQTLMEAAQGSGSVVRKAPFVMSESAADNVRQGFVTDENFSQTVVGNSIAEDEHSAESLTTIDSNGGDEFVKAASTITNDADVNDPTLANYDPSKPIIKRQTAETNSDLTNAALMSITTKRTEASIAGGRNSIVELADLARSSNTDATHEEAHLQNALYDMEHRDGEDI